MVELHQWVSALNRPLEPYVLLLNALMGKLRPEHGRDPLRSHIKVERKGWNPGVSCPGQALFFDLSLKLGPPDPLSSLSLCPLAQHWVYLMGPETLMSHGLVAEGRLLGSGGSDHVRKA